MKSYVLRGSKSTPQALPQTNFLPESEVWDDYFLDMYFLEGVGAISRMYNLKHQIRYEIWGWKYEKGGFLHAPDTIEEAYFHKSIIAKRKVEGFPPMCDRAIED